MIERWEDQDIYINALQCPGSDLPNNINEHCDKLGLQSWKIVGSKAVQRASLLMLGSNTAGIIATFKRRRQS